MARTDTLPHFLTDVADAIRTKGGTSETIQASSFDTAISNLPSGGGGLDWSAIGYSSTPQGIIDAYNYAVEIQNNWDATKTNLNSTFINDRKLVVMPLVDTSNATKMDTIFSACYALNSVPLLNTSNVTTMAGTFKSCYNLKSIPLFDTSNVQSFNGMFDGDSGMTSIPSLNTSKGTNINNMFRNCSRLTTVPQFDFGKVTTAAGVFTNCSNLTDTSLDNILLSCISMTSFTGTKTLSGVMGFSSSNYSASRIQALPHYQDFTTAGWTIGY